MGRRRERTPDHYTNLYDQTNMCYYVNMEQVTSELCFGSLWISKIQF